MIGVENRPIARNVKQNLYIPKRLKFNERFAIAAALDQKGYSLEADRFLNCGRRVHVFTNESGQYLYGIYESCRSRVCPRCTEIYFKQYEKALVKIIKKINSNRRQNYKKRISFMTLTFRTPTDQEGNRVPISKSYIRKCNKALRQFMNIFYGKYVWTFNKKTRKHSKTKKTVWNGAVAVMEIGPSGNLHYHALVYGPFWNLKFMSEVWNRLTGDSYRLQIDQIDQSTRRSVYKAVRYILKYIRKPPPHKKPSDLVEFVDLLKGIRRIHTFGRFWGAKEFRIEKNPFICPVTGQKMRYAGIAEAGDMIPNFFALRAALDETRYKHELYTFLIVTAQESGPIRWARGENALDSVHRASQSKKKFAYMKKVAYNPNVWSWNNLGSRPAQKRVCVYCRAQNFTVDKLLEPSFN